MPFSIVSSSSSSDSEQGLSPNSFCSIMTGRDSESSSSRNTKSTSTTKSTSDTLLHYPKHALDSTSLQVSLEWGVPKNLKPEIHAGKTNPPGRLEACRIDIGAGSFMKPGLVYSLRFEGIGLKKLLKV